MEKGRKRPNWLRSIEGGKSAAASKKGADVVSPFPMQPPLDEAPIASEVEDINLGLDSLDDDLDPEQEEAVDAMRRWRRVGTEGAPRDAAEVEKEDALIALYHQTRKNRPADFDENVIPRILRESREVVVGWGVDALHAHLAGAEVWKKPSFTQAVFDEIRFRKSRDDFSPRE